MLLLNSTSDVIRVITGAAASTIDCHASWMDTNGTTVTPGRQNTIISTATTTTIVPSPGAGVTRNLKGLYIANDSTGTSCNVSVEHFDGTNQVELIEFILLPGENLGYREDGSWVHRDKQGAEYPPAGLGAYTGNAFPFMKTGTAADVAGCWYCTAKDAGFPGAWSPGTPGINGRVTNGTTAADNGCIPIKNPSVGANYLTEIQMASPLVVPLMSRAGSDGVVIACAVVVVTTANTNAAAIANATVSYTNSDGVAGRTATLSAIAGSQIPATPVIGTIVWFNLAAGDKGVRSIQSITLGTSLGAGAVSLMIARDIAMIGTTIPNVSAQKVIGAPGIRLYNGTCMLHCVMASATTATFFNGEVVVMEK